VDPVAAPAVGEHTQEVLRDLLGYDQDRLDHLAEAGILGGYQENRKAGES